MRKLYEEFYRIYKHKKITDKVMLTRVATTVTVIVTCLIVMSITAYAYFSHNITSASNTIKASNFEVNINVELTTGSGEPARVITANNKTFRIEGLMAGNEYTITVTPTAKTTASTGYIFISANGCNKVYHTQQLGADEQAVGGNTEEIKFKLKITAATDVLLEARWGTSVYYDDYRENGDIYELYITTDETVEMIINAPVSNSDDTIGDDTLSSTEPTTPPDQNQTVPQENTTTEATTQQE